MSAPAIEILKDRLDRIHREEPRVHAWTFLAEEEGAAQASELDSLTETERSQRPLFGVPVGIKDIIHVAGMPTEAGSPLMHGFIASQDARCVERLRKAGAIILGKTATTEFAYYDPATTRNPRNLAHTPGGSSSGSAAGVAAGFLPAALGTQTFGSVIRPAAYCGVIGLKPTYDAISRAGVLPLAWTLDHVGVFSDTVELVAKMADVLYEDSFAGERPGNALQGDNLSSGKRLGPAVAGVPDRYFTIQLDIPVRQGYEAGLDALRRLGVRLQPVSLPALMEQAIAAAGMILRVEAATFHRRWFPKRADEYSPRLRSVLESGNDISAVEYLKARQIRREAQVQMDEVWRQVDFLVTPSAPITAPEGLSWTGDPVFNTPFSVLGNPAVNLPACYSSSGLPSGLQLATRPYSDAKLLRLARLLGEQGFGRVMPHLETRSLHANQ